MLEIFSRWLQLWRQLQHSDNSSPALGLHITHFPTQLHRLKVRIGRTCQHVLSPSGFNSVVFYYYEIIRTSTRKSGISDRMFLQFEWWLSSLRSWCCFHNTHISISSISVKLERKIVGDNQGKEIPINMLRWDRTSSQNVCNFLRGTGAVVLWGVPPFRSHLSSPAIIFTAALFMLGALLN